MYYFIHFDWKFWWGKFHSEIRNFLPEVGKLRMNSKNLRSESSTLKMVITTWKSVLELLYDRSLVNYVRVTVRNLHAQNDKNNFFFLKTSRIFFQKKNKKTFRYLEKNGKFYSKIRQYFDKKKFEKVNRESASTTHHNLSYFWFFRQKFIIIFGVNDLM